MRHNLLAAAVLLLAAVVMVGGGLLAADPEALRAVMTAVSAEAPQGGS